MAHRYHFYRTANINNTPRKYFILIPKHNVPKNDVSLMNCSFFLGPLENYSQNYSPWS